MDKLIDNFPYKKILFLNWYEAALAHLLLFKSLVEKHSNNVYFLISDQGILLKATSLDYLKKADDEITKFFTAKIQELQISASADFYNHIIEDIKEQTDKLKQNRDCPYINLVYSQKFRNSCVAMKKLGYIKPYENWQSHERQRKGFCFLIVRPEYRWKEIASNVYTLVRKRQNNHQKTTKQKPFPLQICYQKFLWFYLKKSFNKFKKSLQIKENKGQKRLTIVIKSQIPQSKDFEREIDVLNFFYRPTRPPISEKEGSKIICLSSLQVQKITQLIYHEFGLPAFVKELRKKMSGFLVIGISDNTQAYETVSNDELQIKSQFSLQDKEDICKINNNKITVVLKLSHRYSIISYEGSNYIQVRLDKPIKQNIAKILKIRLPCLPKYYYWYQREDAFYIIRNYYTQTFSETFERAGLFDQMFMLYSFVSIIEQLHERQIYIGNGLSDSVYLEDKRIIIEPDQKSTKEKDVEKLIVCLKDLTKFIRDEQKKQTIGKIVEQKKFTTFKINKYLLEYIDSRL